MSACWCRRVAVLGQLSASDVVAVRRYRARRPAPHAAAATQTLPCLPRPRLGCAHETFDCTQTALQTIPSVYPTGPSTDIDGHPKQAKPTAAAGEATASKQGFEDSSNTPHRSHTGISTANWLGDFSLSKKALSKYDRLISVAGSGPSVTSAGSALDDQRLHRHRLWFRSQLWSVNARALQQNSLHHSGRLRVTGHNNLDLTSCVVCSPPSPPSRLEQKTSPTDGRASQARWLPCGPPVVAAMVDPLLVVPWSTSSRNPGDVLRTHEATPGQSAGAVDRTTSAG